MADAAPTVTPEIEQALKTNADHVIETLGPVAFPGFGLDAASVKWLEGYVDGQRGVEMDERTFTANLGAFLGEAIIAAVGGAWTYHASGYLGVLLGSGVWCLPFARVRKQLEMGSGSGESVWTFYKIATEQVATER